MSDGPTNRESPVSVDLNFSNRPVRTPCRVVWDGESRRLLPLSRLQASSQYYPYQSATKSIIGGADLHAGGLKSSYVRTDLDAALMGNLFNVSTQASCPFAANTLQRALAATGVRAASA